MTNVQLIADTKVVSFLQSASSESLPAWKRGVLEASSRSTNDTPRATSEISKAMTRARNTLAGKTVDQLNQLGLNRYRANENRETLPITTGLTEMTEPKTCSTCHWWFQYSGNHTNWGKCVWHTGVKKHSVSK